MVVATCTTYSYGLDHDIAVKFASKWDDQKANKVLQWLGALTKKSVSGDFHAALKSGVVLCEALNVLWPNSVASINKSSMAFPQRENVSAFMNACKSRGLRETDTFVTDDLFEARNLVVVLDSIIALGQLAKDKKLNAPVLSVSDVSAPSPIDINAELRAQSQAAQGKTSATVTVNTTATNTSQAKFCGSCGSARANNSSKFCGDCGKGF